MKIKKKKSFVELDDSYRSAILSCCWFYNQGTCQLDRDKPESCAETCELCTLYKTIVNLYDRGFIDDEKK